ncbi:hypothetical protein D3C72_2140760 [compost metagenome]
MKLEVEPVEKLSAHRFAGSDFGTRGGVKGGIVKTSPALAFAARQAPEAADGGVALVGQAHAPLRAARRNLAQLAHDALCGLGGVRRLRGVVQLGPHVLRDFVLEVTHRAGEEHGIQQPATQQACPGVQV